MQPSNNFDILNQTDQISTLPYSLVNQPQILNFENDVNLQKYPATNIINGSNNIFENSLFSKEKLLFCYKVVLRAINSCLAQQYSDFDAHTTANCCHGMSILARNFILEALQLDLYQLRSEGEQKINSLEKNEANDKQYPCTWQIPSPLIELACFYTLAFVREIDLEKGGRTHTRKLKMITPIGTQFCENIVSDLQKRYSNRIAVSYGLYFNEMNEEMQISGAPIKLWGKYIKTEHLRVDRRGIHYASNMFSMQISLAHLILSKSKIAIVSDLINSEGNVKGRNVHILEGDGSQKLRLLNSNEIITLELAKSEPIIVFGACVHLDDIDIESLTLQIDPWLDQFPRLVLACDVYYPQFPRIIDDPTFNNTPILPQEKLLNELIAQHSIEGVSAADPSLFCLAHIYPASIGQLLKVLKREDITALPFSYIPGNKLSPTNETILAKK